MIASSEGKEPVHVGLETTRPRSRRRPKPTADVLTSLSAVNTSNYSSNDPGQRGAVALADHELTEFAQFTAHGLRIALHVLASALGPVLAASTAVPYAAVN